MNDKEKAIALSPPLKWLYVATVFTLVFSGFGQMPIFKRYYLADIPGLAWTADFYVTLVIHYLAATVFIGLSVYYVLTHLLQKDLLAGMNARRWVRGVLFLALLTTGSILMFRNLRWFHIPPDLAAVAAFSHVGLCMLYLLMAATFFRFGRKKE